MAWGYARGADLRGVDVLVLEKNTEPSQLVRSLGLHVRTVRRDWQAARLFLAHRLRDRDGDEA